MFCIVYALIGIPLTLMLLAVVGNHIVHYLNGACAWLVNRIRRYHREYEFESADDQINAPVWIALPIIFLFLAIMSFMYCALEGWDFGTALYFIFITFTTIGFGDVVPQSQAVRMLFSDWLRSCISLDNVHQQSRLQGRLPPLSGGAWGTRNKWLCQRTHDLINKEISLL